MTYFLVVTLLLNDFCSQWNVNIFDLKMRNLKHDQHFYPRRISLVFGQSRSIFLHAYMRVVGINGFYFYCSVKWVSWAQWCMRYKGSAVTGDLPVRPKTLQHLRELTVPIRLLLHLPPSLLQLVRLTTLLRQRPLVLARHHRLCRCPHSIRLQKNSLFPTLSTIKRYHLVQGFWLKLEQLEVCYFISYKPITKYIIQSTNFSICY